MDRYFSCCAFYDAAIIRLNRNSCQAASTLMSGNWNINCYRSGHFCLFSGPFEKNAEVFFDFKNLAARMSDFSQQPLQNRRLDRGGAAQSRTALRAAAGAFSSAVRRDIFVVMQPLQQQAPSGAAYSAVSLPKMSLLTELGNLGDRCLQICRT